MHVTESTVFHGRIDVLGGREDNDKEGSGVAADDARPQ
jgi:hypothetical protein